MENKQQALDRVYDRIRTVTYKKNFPDAAMTALANKLGDRLLNCEKQDGKWVLTYLDTE